MSKARDLYPEYAANPVYGPCSYQPIIDSLGKVLVQVEDNDYEGDTRVVVTKDGKYGFTVIGWGSCSGCDALQAVTSVRALDELIDSLVNDVRWFASLGELKEYVLSDDRAYSHYYHDKEWGEFLAQVRALTDEDTRED